MRKRYQIAYMLNIIGEVWSNYVALIVGKGERDLRASPKVPILLKYPCFLHFLQE